jgi:threonylcarbamoyladenosine tRNA methylthiotransferase MtaB
MKVFLDSVGCRLNQAEIERYARQFQAAGHSLVANSQEADLALVNTCAVTSAAVSDSRQKIRQINRSGAAQVLVTGCWSTLQPEEAEALPGVRYVVPNADKDHLVADWLGLPRQTFDLEPLERVPIPGARLRTRAFIKTQDGCDNRCTFCVTTLARGSSRSVPLPTLIKEIRAALRGGPENSLQSAAREIVLTGVHLGSWGKDLPGAERLQHLVETILAETEVDRLRLSSLEPWDLGAEFFTLWENPRLCRHIHLPLQSGSAATLRRMARKTTPRAFAQLVQAVRQAVPGVAITTDIISGFPGENEAEFAECLAFVRQMGFAGGHVFTYSPRPGTAAAAMPGQVPETLRKERGAHLRAVLDETGRAYQESFLGAVMPVLWESARGVGPQGWQMSGLTDNYLRVNAHLPRHLWNQITPVRLNGLGQQGFSAELV